MNVSRTLLIALVALALVSTCLAQDDIRRVGIPLVFEVISGTAPDGTQVSGWNALLGLWSGQFATTPDGEEFARLTLVPLLQRESITVIDRTRLTIPFPLPLLNFSRQGEVNHFSYFFPFIWYRQDVPKSEDDRTGWAMLPLLWRDFSPLPSGGFQSWLVAFPFAINNLVDADGENLSHFHMLFPYSHRSSILPGLESESGEPVRQSDWRIFPLTWGWRGESFDHLRLYPLFFWNVDRSMVLFPLLFWGEDYLLIGPIWGREAQTYIPPEQVDPEQIPLTAEYQYYLFPLFVHYRQQRGEQEAYRENHLLFPLLTWGDGGGRTERRIFPLWRRGTRVTGPLERTSVWALSPFYWHGRTRMEGQVQEAHDVVFPLYWDLRSAPGGNLSEGRDESTHINTLFPLWYRRTVDGRQRTLSIAWPLFISLWGDQPDDPEARAPFSCLVGILNAYQRAENGDTDLTVLWPLFRRQRFGPEIHSNTLLFLVSTHRDPDAQTGRVGVLWRLFEYTRERDDRGIRLFYLPWRIPLP